MKDYLKQDEWNIIEEGFYRKHNKISESIFSIGNGRMGQRANFEEKFSGETMLGNYVAGVYYPDKTRVGWWKNGYPEYFAKVLNAANWVGIDIEIDGEIFDLAECEVDNFRRVLNMKEGYLERTFKAKLTSGKEVKVEAKRFCSIVDDEVGAIFYKITALNFSGEISISPYIDFDVKNEDANYDDKFWVEIDQHVEPKEGYVLAETKKTAFQVCTGMKFQILKNGDSADHNAGVFSKEKYVSSDVKIEVTDGDEITILKYGANLSSENHPKGELIKNTQSAVNQAFIKGFDLMLDEQRNAWLKKWEKSDIIIEGDVAAQQGIRFNIFHLNQTYTGEDARLNIGPKGFTGEKYGGSTYWDTEAYCIPFYLATSDQKVSRNLLMYRYKQLDKAIENAAKLGFKTGAALYPMVTMNGEECHNEWEITFEEIHRNGAIAYGIYDYVRHTGDKEYLIDYGTEVLIAIARFWAQRVHFSERRGKYVIHGVTGPNEYENNVNNNWYTNFIASWCMKYAFGAITYMKEKAPEKWAALEDKIKFYEYAETGEWKKITDNIYLPHDEKLDVFVQHDGFLDKELIKVSDLPAEDQPLNQKWSWDRILRSCFIKQADVLQGLYFFEELFDEDTHRRNFEFYEPMTVHESSLSPCVHSILAAKLGMKEKAYEMYLRTARLDLDDYNNDTEDGLHITSMAGTWMAVVKGFGGMRVLGEQLILNPFLPNEWKSFSFKILFKKSLLQVIVGKEQVEIKNLSNINVHLEIYKEHYDIPAKSSAKFYYEMA
jgi:maltose phosphorylase